MRLLGILEAHLRDAMTVTKGHESKRADFMAQVRREHRAILAAIVAGNAKAASDCGDRAPPERRTASDQ